MTLGAKRNFMHTKATGSIIVYMDDDVIHLNVLTCS